jgi:Calcineurin-like phosphoesterase
VQAPHISCMLAVATTVLAVAIAAVAVVALLPSLSGYLSSSTTRLGGESWQSTDNPESHAGSCVLAFADLHGDLEQAEKVLSLVGAVDPDGHWAAAGCTLVQTGDLVDRGPESLALLKRFEDLKTEASEHIPPGKVITLAGNHELMQLQVRFTRDCGLLGLHGSSHLTDAVAKAIDVVWPGPAP